MVPLERDGVTHPLRVADGDRGPDAVPHVVDGGKFHRELAAVQVEVRVAELFPEEVDDLHLLLEVALRARIVLRCEDGH